MQYASYDDDTLTPSEAILLLSALGTFAASVLSLVFL
jgi:hypothetical protein